MAEWPTADDLRSWMRSEQFMSATGEDAEALELAMESTIETMQERLDVDLMPDDSSCPMAVRLGLMIRAAAFYMRRDSPTGIIQFSPDSVFRVNRMDADVDTLISPWLMIAVA